MSFSDAFRSVDYIQSPLKR